MYFPTDDFTEANFVIFHAGLYYLFLEQHSLTPDPATKAELEPHVQQIRQNLETALANTSLFTSLKIENVQALLLGVGRVPSLQALTFKAANLVRLCTLSMFVSPLSLGS